MPNPILSFRRRPRLRTLLTLMALLLSTLVAGVLAALHTAQIDAQAQAATAALELQQAQGVMAAVDADLARFGLELEAQAHAIEALGLLAQPPQLQALLDQLFDTPGFAWAGVTDAQGRVLAGLDGLLVGMDVSQRDWWGAARQGLHYGDVHEAKLLAGLLPPLPSGEPWRFVDIAVPLHDRAGHFAGVLALHLSWPWLRERIRLYSDTAPEQGAQLFIAGRDGRQRLGPEGAVGTPLPLAGDVPGWGLLQWPDGRPYVTAWAASRGSAPYAGLGWVALVRMPLEAVQAANASALHWTWGAAALGVAGTTALAWLLATLVLLPVGAFVARVRGIADGADVPPPRLLPAEFAHMHEVVRELVQRLREKEAALRGALEDVRGGFDSVGRALPGLLFTRVRRADGVHHSHLSASAPHYLGVPREEILADRSGQAWLRRAEAEDARHIAKLLPRADAGEALDCAFRVQGADGRWRSLRATLVPREDGSTPPRVLDAIVLDVTALEEARAQAQRASEAKDRFLATMSHELRTPLNALLGYTHLLHSRLVGDENRRDAERIRQAGELLLRILNEVLDLTKIEADRLELERLPLRLEALLQSCHELFEPNATAKGLRLELALPRRPLPWVLGDAARLQQVLSNLLSNALKFTPQGCVALVLAPQDGADVGDATLRVRLEVRDSGIGLTQEQRQRLFEPFRQADSATARQYGGTGLGLWISRRLVQAMGGEVELESAPGQGTTVRLHMAFERAPAAAVAAAADAAGAPTAPGLAPRRRVLVVDDVAINREVLGALLRHLGHAVEECGDGESAIARVAAGGIDLVLMDVVMPGMDGLESARAIRALPGDPGRVPLWAVTGRAYEQDVTQVHAAGMDGHLSKPVNLAALSEVLRALDAAEHGTPAP